MSYGKLLEYKVRLPEHLWFTYNYPDGQERSQPGVDIGGQPWLIKELHDRIEYALVFQTYVVKRFWLHDFPDRDPNAPVTWKMVKHLTLHRHYDVAISFHSPGEAMAFKLMME